MVLKAPEVVASTARGCRATRPRRRRSGRASWPRASGTSPARRGARRLQERGDGGSEVAPGLYEPLEPMGPELGGGGRGAMVLLDVARGLAVGELDAEAYARGTTAQWRAPTVKHAHLRDEPQTRAARMSSSPSASKNTRVDHHGVYGRRRGSRYRGRRRETRCRRRWRASRRSPVGAAGNTGSGSQRSRLGGDLVEGAAAEVALGDGLKARWCAAVGPEAVSQLRRFSRRGA